MDRGVSGANAPRDVLFAPGRRALTVGLVLTITLTAFEILAISTVMPIVARELGGLERYGWVFTAFFLGTILGIVVVGGVIDRRGLGLTFVVGLGLFSVGLAVGGLAPSMEILIAARLLQGLGAGTVQPIAYVAIGRRLPERLRPQMFALLSAAWIVPALIGPGLAGIIGDTVGWRFVFLGLLPLIAIAGLTTYPAIRHITALPAAPSGSAATTSTSAAPAALRRLTALALLVTVGTALLTAGLTSGEPVLLIGLGGMGLLVGLPALRALTPAGTLRAARGIPAAILLRGILTFAFFAVDAYVALVLVELRGLSATQAGVTLTVATLAWSVGSWAQARFAPRFGPEWFARTGFAVVVVGIALFAFVLDPAIPVWVAIPTFAVMGLGMGLAHAPLSLIVLRDAPPAEQGSATSALSLTDSLGTALGTGVTGAFVAASVRLSDGPGTGLAIGFGVAILVGLLGLAVTGRLGSLGGVVGPAASGPSVG